VIYGGSNNEHPQNCWGGTLGRGGEPKIPVWKIPAERYCGGKVPANIKHNLFHIKGGSLKARGWDTKPTITVHHLEFSNFEKKIKREKIDD